MKMDANDVKSANGSISDSCGHQHEKGCGCHHHEHGERHFWAPAVSFVMLIAGVLMSYFDVPMFTNRWVELGWYIIAFLPVGLPAVKEAIEGVQHHDYFNEFTLMVIACIGAFCIWELPEAVGVMLFYSVGESLQHRSVDNATRNISRLLDMRGEKANVMREGKIVSVSPKDVRPGETIEVRPGERVPLDGEMDTSSGYFDTSALTGESVPREIVKGGEVLAGMVASDKMVRIKVTKEYSQSTLSRILDMVNNASSRKAHAEMFIRKFARVYPPIVMALATLMVLIPAAVSCIEPTFHYDFSQWLYRALVFLVISCPCALVVSVPLAYFAGIGAASRAGILFKGGNYLEAISKVKSVAFDKTGTLTTGKFSVTKVEGDETMLSHIAAAESGSTHPLALALIEYVVDRGIDIPHVQNVIETAGHGTQAVVGNKKVMAGNLRMLKAAGIDYPLELPYVTGTMIVCAIDGRYAGYVVLADTIKDDSVEAIRELRELCIDDVMILSGDRQEIVSEYARQLNIDAAYGELLPQDKADYVAKASSVPGGNIAFVGDGMNDAPVLALSDVGIAMGGLGSDAAIESADVVIQTDQPSKIATAIKIGRTTRTIVVENIVGAIGIKTLILALGAAGVASLWAAVFADVGVALLAVLNSMRIMRNDY